MAANVKTGRTREVRYCGVAYSVQPSTHPDAITGRKQVWEVLADGVVIKPWVLTLSRCMYYIHEHAVNRGGLSMLNDGCDYQTALRTVMR